MSDNTMNFDGLYVRPCGERDREYLEDLVESDPYHKDTLKADDFLRLMPGEQAFVVEDEMGYALLYFKTATVVRITMQFIETRNAQERARNRHILQRGLEWLEERLRGRFRELIFNTESPALTLTAKKRLGFQALPQQLSRLIPPVRTADGVEGVWQHLPQASEIGEG